MMYGARFCPRCKLNGCKCKPKKPPPAYNVRVEQQYIPSVQQKIPAYGVSTEEEPKEIVVFLTIKVPEELALLLERHLVLNLWSFAPEATESCALYAERVTHDFLSMHVLSGNLRYDSIADGWRWIQPVASSNPADSR